MEHSIRTVLREAADLLALVPDGAPRLEAEILLAQATGFPRTRLLSWPEQPVSPPALQRFREYVDRRRHGEPIAYIRGHQDFWSLELRVTPDTLIPRPETELLVELVLARLPRDAPLKVVDAGTGSGAIAAAIAHERPDWWIIATERSEPAARVARENLRHVGRDTVFILRSDWLAPVARQALDAVICNPPYIPDTDPHLTRGDLRFEPRAALAGGPDGLSAIRRLAAEAAVRLRPGGLIALEHGYDQGGAVRGILATEGYTDIETSRDLADLERVTLGLATPRAAIG